MALLEIKDLHASIGDTEILKGINLTINKGEVHAIMGPNGSGKSTLSYVLSGRDGYEVTGGDILLDGESVLEMEADERARAGMFLAFQYPVELPGVGGMSFLGVRSMPAAVMKAWTISTTLSLLRWFALKQGLWASKTIC